MYIPHVYLACIYHISNDYKFKLTTAFQKALNDQEAAVTLYYSYPPTPGNHPPAH